MIYLPVMIDWVCPVSWGLWSCTGCLAWWCLHRTPNPQSLGSDLYKLHGTQSICLFLALGNDLSNPRHVERGTLRSCHNTHSTKLGIALFSASAHNIIYHQRFVCSHFRLWTVLSQVSKSWAWYSIKVLNFESWAPLNFWSKWGLLGYVSPSRAFLRSGRSVNILGH